MSVAIKIQKSLSTRTHRCDVCSTEMCSDQNAAINILQKAILTEGHVGTWEYFLNAWGDLPSWAIGASLSSNGDSMNQESHDLSVSGVVRSVNSV